MKNQENLKEDNLGSSEDILNISQKVCLKIEGTQGGTWKTTKIEE